MDIPDLAACPHVSLSHRAGLANHTGQPVEARGDVFMVHDFHLARDLLRTDELWQAGFMAETVPETNVLRNRPVLYSEGEKHHEMRRGTARYFTPTHVAQYQGWIAALADDLVAELIRRGEVDLAELNLKLAVQVAARVMGLTESLAPGMERRITAFISGKVDSEPGLHQPQMGLELLRQNANVGIFYLVDVRPAIQARRKRRQDDLISYLLDRGYNDLEIMTECVTYGSAGMVTTREFISMAAYTLLQNPDLRARYVHGTEPERTAILHEILRLEPVVTVLYRRARQQVQVGGHTIPPGSVVALSVQSINLDPQVVGPEARALCPGRPLPRSVQPQVMAFGDGHHRCPGAYLAIKESDVFLRRLLIWNDLTVAQTPVIRYNEVVKGYEVHGLRVRLGQRA